MVNQMGVRPLLKLKWLAREHGAVSIMLALLLPAALAMVAIAVDAGALLLAREQMQVSADAAALAAVQEATLEVEREVTPIERTVFVEVNEPMPHDIVSIREIYDDTGELVGYRVKYIAGYRDRVVD